MFYKKFLLTFLLLFTAGKIAAQSDLPPIPIASLSQPAMQTEVDEISGELGLNNVIVPKKNRQAFTSEPELLSKDPSLQIRGQAHGESETSYKVLPGGWIKDEVKSQKKEVIEHDQSSLPKISSGELPVVSIDPVAVGASSDDPLCDGGKICNYKLKDPQEQKEIDDLIKDAKKSAGVKTGAVVSSPEAHNSSGFFISENNELNSNYENLFSQNASNDLQNKSSAALGTADVSEEQVASALASVGSYVKGYTDAEDKEDYIKNTASSYVAGEIDSRLHSLLESFEGVHASISLCIDDLFNAHLRPAGKILLPLHNEPTNIEFLQTGLTRASGDRNIMHIGLGSRWFPEATSMSELGSYMLGVNAVADFDLSRGHRRLSLGGEYVNENFALAVNAYHRLTGWRDSYDFESGYVQERPASGFDLKTKIFIPRVNNLGQLAVTASLTHWMGRDIAPFGTATSVDELENNPWIYGLGLNWQVVPALAFELKHEISNGGHHNSYAGITFNIPLGAEYSYKDAFNPNATDATSGLSLKTYRSAFIDRDYTMPLQYRATPGKFHIKYCGLAGDNKYCFNISDGFGRPGQNLSVKVTAKDACVKLSNNGNYVSDGNGNFYPEITQSCKNKTTLHVTVGDTEQDFDVLIQKITLKISASPVQIPRYATSTVTLTSEGDGIEGTQYKWTLDNAGADAAGVLIGVANGESWSDRKTSIVFKPNTAAVADYDATVRCEVYGTVFTQVIHVKVYGTSEDSLNFADGRDLIEGNEIIPITYTDLEPGSSVTWNVRGEAKAGSAVKDDGTLENASTSLTVADDDKDGVITVYIQGNDVDDQHDAPAQVTVAAQTAYQTFTLSKSIGVYSYVPASTADPSVDPGRVFSVTVTGLKDGTYAEFSALAEVSADGALTQGKVTRDPAFNGNNAKVLVANGQAQMHYKLADDVYKGKIKNINVKYYRNVGVPEIIYQEIPEVSINTYDPALHANFTNFSEGDVVPLVVVDGLEDQKLQWNVISGAGTLASDNKGNNVLGRSAVTKFGDGGVPSESMLFFKGLKPQATPEKIKIEVHTMADTLDTDHMLGANDSDPGENKYNSWDNQILTVPSILEYKAKGPVTLTGLKPNSKAVITIEAPSKVNESSSTAVSVADIPLSQSEVTADAAGKASVELTGVENFNVKDFKVKAVVAVSTAETKEMPLQTVPMQAHALTVQRVGGASLTPFKDQNINTLGYVDVKISGGFPGENVKATLDASGEASFSEKTENKVLSDLKFDAQGTQTVRIYSHGTFTGTPKVTAEGIERSAFVNVPYTKTALTPVITLPTLPANSTPMSLYKAALADQTGYGYVDFNTGSSFAISGLLKNSTIKATAAGNALTCTKADGSGNASCTLPAYSDTPAGDVDCTTRKVYYSTKDISVSYVDPAVAGYTAPTATNTAKGSSLKVYQYAFNMEYLNSAGTAVQSEIYGDESFIVRITNAHPGTPVKLTITGDGTLSASSCTPNAQGTCQVTCQGKSPFATSIEVAAETDY